ncbi:hypothetical protein ACIPY2_05960 [Paenarthrobacter sp. NPDC089675]
MSTPAELLVLGDGSPVAVAWAEGEAGLSIWGLPQYTLQETA